MSFVAADTDDGARWRRLLSGGNICQNEDPSLQDGPFRRVQPSPFLLSRHGPKIAAGASGSDQLKLIDIKHVNERTGALSFCYYALFAIIRCTIFFFFAFSPSKFGNVYALVSCR